MRREFYVKTHEKSVVVCTKCRIFALTKFYARTLFIYIMAENNNQQQLQFNLDPEVAKGLYANLALITHSNNEFIIDFAQMLPGMPKANVGSRVIMVPEHAKRLLMALQENLYKYEQQFGRIELPGQQGGRTIAPFGNGKGEA